MILCGARPFIGDDRCHPIGRVGRAIALRWRWKCIRLRIFSSGNDLPLIENLPAAYSLALGTEALWSLILQQADKSYRTSFFRGLSNISHVFFF